MRRIIRRTLGPAVALLGLLGLTVRGADPPRQPPGRPEARPIRPVLSLEDAPAPESPQPESLPRPAQATPGPVTPPASPALSLAGAVRFALVNNPQLTSVRQQRGVAAGAVTIARTYPFNPLFQALLMGVSAPRSEGVTNHFFQEYLVRQEIELFGQIWHRKRIAAATVSRTEWEIAAQELNVAIASIRAYNSILYRQRKLAVLDETVRLNEQVVTQGQKLVELGRLRPADVILARSELETARAQVGQGRTALAVARNDMRRQLGSTDDAFVVVGDLDRPPPTTDINELTRAALDQRPDLHARQAAVAEAEGRLKLEVANRFGNPQVGPAYEYNETRVNFIGVSIQSPLPLINTRPGEIQQRRAELARSRMDLRQVEIQTRLDVQAALARLAEARRWADSYTTDVLPELEKARQDMDRLFSENEPGVDILRVLSVQRNMLRAADAQADALFEVSQAQADLAAAVGDPALAVGVYAPEDGPRPCLTSPAAGRPCVHH